MGHLQLADGATDQSGTVTLGVASLPKRKGQDTRSLLSRESRGLHFTGSTQEN